VAHKAFGVGLLQVTDLAPDGAAATEGHGAQAKFGDKQAGAAECALLHVNFLRELSG
jgi:hypothetical protein